MRTIPQSMWDIWAAGGPFIGDFKPAGRVTVETAWNLNTANVGTLDASKLPFRWFQRVDNSQTELEIPNIKSIQTERTLDSDAATCTITMYNVSMDPNNSGSISRLGNRGAYTWRERDISAVARWGARPTSVWDNVLVPNALLRTYQGFGGQEKSLTDAITDENVILTGVWLIDDVTVGTNGMLTIKCRDMAKLLIEQQLYPPLVPTAKYPLQYRKWVDTEVFTEAIPFYDSTDPVQNSPDPGEGPKYVTDIALAADNSGYWILGSDGGVFAYGVPFYGSRGSYSDGYPMVGIAADPLNRGYWLVNSDGAVYAFGECGYYGGADGLTLSAPVVKIVAHPTGRGYWLVAEDGGVFAYGSATFEGSLPDTDGYKVVDMGCTPTGEGYWLVDERGGIFSYGDATFHGNFLDMSANKTVAIGVAKDGRGYWVVRKNGDVSPFGSLASVRLGANGPWAWDNTMRVLNDPIFSISVTADGGGYVLVGGDGGVFSFGTAPFWGSLPGPFALKRRTAGNYNDYVDIIRDLLLWSGWLAYGTGQDDVYGNLESTGAFAEDELPPDMFDKKPVIDAINAIKEVVGYHFWIDDEGAARFEWPNWFSVGNRVDTGERTRFIPEIDERVQLTDYTVQFSDKNWRSEIIISSADPDAEFADTVTTRYHLPTTSPDLVRGLVRPAMWWNEHFSSRVEQERMAELVGLHIQRSLRQGQLTCVANPAIQVNDQVRIYEEVTGESYIHYVRGVSISQDLDAGTYDMRLTTNWLADSTDIDPVSVTVELPAPSTSSSSTTPSLRTNRPNFNLLFDDDFTVTCGEGAFLATYGAASGRQYKWSAYPTSYLTTEAQSTGSGNHYATDNISVVSGIEGANGNVMQMRLLPKSMTPDNKAWGAAPIPLFAAGGTSAAQTYGRYEYRVWADRVSGWHPAWLLWPLSDDLGTLPWPEGGETDFPEGDLSGYINAYHHHFMGSSGGAQDAYTTSIPWNQWNTCAIEWKPNSCKYILNGVVIGETTGAHVVPNPMRVVLQTETSVANPLTPANVYVDYVSVWGYTP